MSRPISLRREWFIRIVTGLVMIPVAFLVAGAIAAILPENAQAVGLAIGGLVFIIGSMVISMLIVHRKAK